MTMAFRTLKDSVISLLGTAAASRFRVVGYKQRATSAEENADALRTVQVFYSGGQFPKNSGGSMGPIAHDVTLKMELIVAAAASGDLAALASPDSSAAEFAAALESFQESAECADIAIDELADIVYQIIMDGRNINLGLTTGDVSNRWIAGIEKNAPNAKGEYVVMSASMDLTCRVSEVLAGDPGVAADPDIGPVDTEIETNMFGSDSADPAPSAVRSGGI